MTDEFGNTKFWQAENLLRKEEAHLVHPTSDMGNNHTYYFGGAAIENAAVNFTPYQPSLKTF